LLSLKRQQKTKQPRGFRMRKTRVAQMSIFENYSEHEYGVLLNNVSSLLDRHPEILTLLERDLIDKPCAPVGCNGLTVESIFRCLFLKQQLRVSYEQLAFHLSDSMSYRSFVRLPHDVSPSRSGLQSTIRRIKPETLEKVHQLLSVDWFNNGHISLEQIRVDSTVIKSNIAPPSDSQLLNDGVRVLSRYLAKSRELTGKKISFSDQRKASKSLAFRIFNAKNAVKEVLYPDILRLVGIVLRQIERGLLQVRADAVPSQSTLQWIDNVMHYRDLLLKIVDQTERRVINKEQVPSSEKIVSLFEPHTDIIVKGFRDTQYGHKVNLCSDKSGFITYFSIEEGNPADKELFMPVLLSCQENFDCLPKSIVGDGGYASKDNVLKGRALGVKRVAFHKRIGISYHAMGVKRKTFEQLRNFRAGVEGNISELKRAFGAGKATWKSHDGFKAYAWSSVIGYNLVRLARLESG